MPDITFCYELRAHYGVAPGQAADPSTGPVTDPGQGCLSDADHRTSDYSAAEDRGSLGRTE